MKNFYLTQSKIVDGFFAKQQEINATVTLKAVYARFKDTGRFAALKCKALEQRTHFFWDSDIAKWLEAVAYLLARKEDKQLEEYFNEAVEDIISNQLPNGYYNSYFQVYDPESVFVRRTDHELYCAGHLFEAAVAAAQYLGDDRLLTFSEKFVDYIYDRFIVKKDVGFTTPGHQEIELALLRLYHLTGKEKYKELSMFFLNERGVREEMEHQPGERSYSQSHLPIRQQETAEGHAVRALYLYIAMADMAKTSNDEQLKATVEKLFDDITTKKMYVTGGTGSAYPGERFSVPYDLPAATAYNETCAAIALILFCDKMLELTGEAKYGHVVERTLYNGMLAGVSLQGNKFFYINPLEVNAEKNRYNQSIPKWKEDTPINERVELFFCSCCPPNICRFIEEINGLIYYQSEDNNVLTVSQYISSQLSANGWDVAMQADFPVSGKVSLRVNTYGQTKTIKLRIPEWCDQVFNNAKDGYLIYEGVFNDEEIVVDFSMRLRKVYPNVRINDAAGKIALSYGPLILCAEGADNPFALSAVEIDAIDQAKISVDNTHALKVTLPAILKENNQLYSYQKPTKKEILLTLIPYFSWGNRGENDMRVWFVEA